MKIKSVLTAMALVTSSALAATKVTFDSANNTVVDGKTMFPISVAVLPPPDGKTPEGKSAWEEFAEGGVNLARIAPTDCTGTHGWNEAGLQKAGTYMDQMHSANIYVWMTISQELGFLKPDDRKGKEELTMMIDRFKDHPAMLGWKGADEPQWGNMNTHGKRPPSSIATSYKLIHELDPNHPVLVLQAPRGSAADNAAYDPYLDVTGMDIFPVSYPPGKHVQNPTNTEISQVGDWTKISVEAAHGKPVWMTLQVAWSGVSRPGHNTLRYPTFAQERFMTYEAIIDGARGINYFGGGHAMDQILNERDKQLGYNWTFWERVLKPVLAEINAKSPLASAMIAPNSKMPVKVDGKGIEFVVREVGDDIYVLACEREKETIQVKFSGLPEGASGGEVMYEEPRKVTASNGSFTDWFGPFEVHVYRFKR